MKRVYNAPWP